MFTIGNISIAASAVAENCIANLTAFFVRNVTTLLLDRESMVILNSSTATMQMTRDEFDLLQSIDKIWRDEVDSFVSVNAKLLKVKDQVSAKISSVSNRLRMGGTLDKSQRLKSVKPQVNTRISDVQRYVSVQNKPVSTERDDVSGSRSISKVIPTSLDDHT
jgi:hypothetical protein